MATIIKTKRGTHIITSSNYGTINADTYVHDTEINTLEEALISSSKIVIGKTLSGSYNLTKAVEIMAITNTMFEELTVSSFCILDNLNIKSLIINAPCIIINSKLSNIIINQPSGFILLKNNVITNLKVVNIGKNDFSLHIENNQLKGKINLNDFSNENTNTVIYFNNNYLKEKIYLDNTFDASYLGTITIYHNYYELNDGYFIDTNFKDLILYKDNYTYLNNELYYFDNELYTKYSGYDKKYISNITKPFKELDWVSVRNSIDLPKYQKLNVLNIPQYISYENDPALNVGCEATACATALSYILNKKITKNQIATYMQQVKAGEKSFWEAFIGDIYQDGWGCMSSVSVNAINNFLKANNLDGAYEVINLTNTPLYELLKYLSIGLPIIVWSTMGNDQLMFHKKYGSTIFNINKTPLYWPGRDHSLVIAGYNLLKAEIYLADPEVNSTELRVRNIFEFENRFAELYSQSIIVMPKIKTKC